MLVLRSTYNEVLRELDDTEIELDSANSKLNREATLRAQLAEENYRLRAALNYIVRQRTQAPNATVTRILATAENVLGIRD